jgi:hypothetical protein
LQRQHEAEGCRVAVIDRPNSLDALHVRSGEAEATGLDVRLQLRALPDARSRLCWK